MHLSTGQTKALADLMRLLADATDGDELRRRMALPLLDLLRADTYVSMVWNGGRQRFEQMTALNMSEDNLRSWDDYFRFVDPLTFPMMQRRKPTVATQVLCQSALSRTEFFNDFLLRDRMYWGVNVYFYDPEQCVGDVRIWRDSTGKVLLPPATKPSPESPRCSARAASASARHKWHGWSAVAAPTRRSRAGWDCHTRRCVFIWATHSRSFASPIGQPSLAACGCC